MIQNSVVVVLSVGNLVLVSEATQFMRPLHCNLIILSRNTKEFLNGLDNRNQRIVTAGKQIQGDHTLIGPCVETNVRFEQNSDARNTLGDELVAMVGKHGQTGVIDSVDHSFGKTFFGIQKGSFDAFNVHQKMLDRSKNGRERKVDDGISILGLALALA